jgi:hypothetical protein
MKHHATEYAPVFITGGWGSGTTLIRSMIGSHPAIFLPFETVYFRQIWAHYPALHTADFTDDGALYRLVEAFFETPRYQLVAGDLDAQVYHQAMAAVPTAERTLPRLLSVFTEVPMRLAQKTRWGAKSPDLVNHLDMVYALYPDAYLIHIIRDGRAVANSRQGKKSRAAAYKVKEAPRYLGFETPSGEAVSWRLLDYAADWHLYLEIARQHTRQAAHARYLEIRYEALLDAPRAELERVCSFLDAPFDEAMLRYYEKPPEAFVSPSLREAAYPNVDRPPDPTIAQRWRDKLSPAAIHALQRAIGPVLKQEGYDLVEVKLTASDRRVIDQNVAAWRRERAREALRRRLGEMPLLRQARAAYRAVRQKRSDESA